MTEHQLQSASRRRRQWYACVAGVVSLSPLAVSAQPVSLTYEAPPDCPNEAAATARIAALVRRQPPVPTVAKATITRQGRSYRLELQVDGGSQRIVSESCDSLVQTLAVILSLAIDPRSQQHSRPESSQPLDDRAGIVRDATVDGESAPEVPTAPVQAKTSSVAAAPTSAPPTPSAGAPRARVHAHSEPVATTDRQESQALAGASHAPNASGEHQRASTWRLRPSLQLGTEYGMMPHLAHGPNLGLWLDLRNWWFAATAEWLLPQWAQMPGNDPNRGGNLSFLGGKVSGCGQVLAPQLFGICVGVEAGDMMGKGSGVANTRLGHGLWLAGTLDVAVRPRIWSKMSADLRLGIALPVKRPTFGIEGYPWRFEPHGWSLRLASGFSWF